jgi:hypothetical protein
MNMLLAAALGGSLLGFTLLWAHGVLAALLGAQLGAISLAFLMCPILALRRTKVERKQSAGFRLIASFRERSQLPVHLQSLQYSQNQLKSNG